MTLTLILLVVAAVLFAVASFKVSGPVHLGWAGALLVTVAVLTERL